MKTTIEFTDSFAAEIKAFARKKGISLKQLIEGCLRERMKQERERSREFRLRRHPFKGNGLVAELQGAAWKEISEQAYSGRGEP